MLADFIVKFTYTGMFGFLKKKKGGDRGTTIGNYHSGDARIEAMKDEFFKYLPVRFTAEYTFTLSAQGLEQNIRGEKLTLEELAALADVWTERKGAENGHC